MDTFGRLREKQVSAYCIIEIVLNSSDDYVEILFCSILASTLTSKNLADGSSILLGVTVAVSDGHSTVLSQTAMGNLDPDR